MEMKHLRKAREKPHYQIKREDVEIDSRKAFIEHRQLAQSGHLEKMKNNRRTKQICPVRPTWDKKNWI